MNYSTGEVYYAKLHQGPQDEQGNYKCVIIEKNTLRKYKGFESSDVNELEIFEKLAVSAPPMSSLEFQDDSKIIEVFAKSSNALDKYIDSKCSTKEIVPSLPKDK